MSRQKWGQHFLTDTQVIQSICDAFQPPEDFAEIGPGRGALTNRLQERFKQFQIFEIDPNLAALHTTSSQVSLLGSDFLQWNFEIDGKRPSNFSLIGNLPYESGSEMVKQIALNSDAIEHFVFMLQKEVCERLTAQPGTRDFSSFTVLTQSQYRIESLSTVPASAFAPPPRVESQVIRGFRRSTRPPLTKDYKRFLKMAFAQKRKTLRNTLKSTDYSFSDLQARFQFSDSIRAEEISVAQWWEMFQSLQDR